MITDTEGIVLRQTKAAAGRRLILVFTQKYGKISIGTGLNERTGRTKSALAIRPFTYARYELFKNRGYYDLNGAEVIRSFYSFGEDLEKYGCASLMLELTERLMPEELPEPRVFALLLSVLEALEKRRAAHVTLLLAFEVKLLDILGTAPVLDCCASCGSDKTAVFSIRDGGMLCEDCAKKISAKTAGEPGDRLIYRPKFDIVKVLRFFSRRPVGDFEKIALDEGTAAVLQGIMRRYMEYHLDIGRLKSDSMLLQYKQEV